jgi:hypothetical protein
MAYLDEAQARPTQPKPATGQAPRRPLSPPQTEWRGQFFRQKGWQSKTAGQAVLKTAIQPMIDKALSTLIGQPGSAAPLKDAKLEPGKEFKAYIKALEAYEKLKAPHVEQPQYAKLRDELHKAAQDYIAHFNTHSDKQKQQTHTKFKHQVCQKTLSDLAAEPRLHKINKPPPWDSETALYAAWMKATTDFESVPGQGLEQLKDDKGVNAAFWINKKGTNGAADKSFIFKPQTTKQDRTSIPVGGEPAREAMTGRAAEVLNGMTGIDFKVPETHIVSVPRERFPDGVLANTGNLADADGSGPLIGSLQQYASTDGQMRNQAPGKLRAVSAQRCQELAILDIVAGNVDRHDGNFMMTRDHDLVPIDNGLSFPEGPGDLDKMSSNHNAMLKLPGAHEPFSADMIKKIDKIDPDALRTALKAERGTIEGVYSSAKGMIGDTALDQSRRRATFLKLACRSLSPAATQVAMGRNAKALFPTDPDPALSDEDFERKARRIIADTVAEQPVLKEFFLVSEDEKKMREDTLQWKPMEEGKQQQPPNWHAAFGENPKMAMYLLKQNMSNTTTMPAFLTAEQSAAVKKDDLDEMTQAFRGAKGNQYQRWLALKAKVNSADRAVIDRKLGEALDAIHASQEVRQGFKKRDLTPAEVLNFLNQYEAVKAAMDNEDDQAKARGASNLLRKKLANIKEMIDVLPAGDRQKFIAAADRLAANNAVRDLDILRDTLIPLAQAELKTAIDAAWKAAEAKDLSQADLTTASANLLTGDASAATANAKGLVLFAKAKMLKTRRTYDF